MIGMGRDRSLQIFLSMIVFSGTSLLNQAYACYLDTVVTKGLALSYKENHSYLLCPWDDRRHRCVQRSEQLVLMRTDGSYRQIILSPPQACWQARSFHDAHKMMLSVEPWGMVNGSLSLQWPLGEIEWVLSHSSRLRIAVRSRTLPET